MTRRATSAGLLLFRRRSGDLEVLLVHMGGPFWSARDEGAWSIPKGEYGEGDDPYAAARREFEEETGASPPDGPAIALGEVRQSGGKRVIAWALPGDFDPVSLRSNTFALEWPPRSGQRREFPEVDRADWFGTSLARGKLVEGQRPFIDRLRRRLDADADVRPT